MKIIKEGSSHLRLQKRDTLPTLVLAMAGGVSLFFSLGILVALYNMGTRSINCQQVQSIGINCTLRHDHFFGLTRETKQLTQVKQVILNTKENRPDEMVIESAQPIVVIKGGSAIVGGWGNLRDLANSLTNFSSSEISKFNRSVDIQLGDYIFLAVGICISIFCCLVINSLISLFWVVNIWDFDKLTGKIFYQRYPILDFLKIWRTKEDYLLSAYNAIEIHHLQDSKNSPPKYAIALIQGERSEEKNYLRIPEYGVANLLKTQQVIATKIGKFLKLPVALQPLILGNMKEVFGDYIVEVGAIDDTSMSLKVLSNKAAVQQKSQDTKYLESLLKSKPRKSGIDKKLLTDLESEAASGKKIQVEGKVLNIILFSQVRIDIEESQADLLYQNLMTFALEIRAKKYLFKTQKSDEVYRPQSFGEKLLLFLAMPLWEEKTRTERVYLGNLLGESGSNMTSVTVLYDKEDKNKVSIEIDEYQFSADIFDRMLEKIQPARREDA